MATLAELRLAIFPAAPAIGDAPPLNLERDVAWVRVLRARVPAFDALEAGDVAIVPARALAVIAAGEIELGGVLDALAAASAAVVLLIEPAGEPAPEWVIAAIAGAAERDGLPAFQVADADPTTLERSIIGYLLNRRGELDHQAGLLEAALTELALADADLEVLVGAVAGFFGRAVALEGSRGETLAIHAPADAPGAASAVTAYLGGARTGSLRVALPGPVDGAGDVSGGRLVLLGDRAASELERAAAARISRILALELARSAAVRRAADSSRREAMPVDGPPWAVLVARQSGPREDRDALRGQVARLATPRRLMLRGDAASLELRAVIAGGDARAGDARAGDARAGEGIADLARRAADVLGRPVAVSRPFDDPLARPAAEAEARATLEAIEALPDPPAVAEAARLPAYRLLSALRSLPDGRRQAEALLAPILTGTLDARRERLATLRAVLEHPGLSEAAEHLGVHRNTLAYRIRRIEAITGWRLGDPELRVPLSLAVRLVQFDQSEP